MESKTSIVGLLILGSMLSIRYADRLFSEQSSAEINIIDRKYDKNSSIVKLPIRLSTLPKIQEKNQVPENIIPIIISAKPIVSQ